MGELEAAERDASVPRNHVSAWIQPATGTYEVSCEPGRPTSPGAPERAGVRRPWIVQSVGRSPAAVLGGQPAGEDAGRPGREEERGIVVDPASHRAHVDAAGAELVDGRLPVHLDELVASPRASRERSASQTAARCASSARHGHRDVHVDLADVRQDRERVMRDAAVPLPLVGEAHAERGDRPAAERRGRHQGVTARQRAHAPGRVGAEVPRPVGDDDDLGVRAAPSPPATPSRRVTASSSPPNACPHVIHPSSRPAARSSCDEPREAARQRRAVRHHVDDPRVRGPLRPGRDRRQHRMQRRADDRRLARALRRPPAASAWRLLDARDRGLQRRVPRLHDVAGRSVGRRLSVPSTAITKWTPPVPRPRSSAVVFRSTGRPARTSPHRSGYEIAGAIGPVDVDLELLRPRTCAPSRHGRPLVGCGSRGAPVAHHGADMMPQPWGRGTARSRSSAC